MRRMRSNERGAAAVEFALVILPLLLILMGIVEYGRLFSIQGTVTNAARVAARTMVITNNATQAGADAGTAAAANPLVTSSQLTLAISPASCSPGALITVTTTYPVQQISGYLPGFAFPSAVKGTGVMRCGG